MGAKRRTDFYSLSARFSSHRRSYFFSFFHSTSTLKLLTFCLQVLSSSSSFIICCCDRVMELNERRWHSLRKKLPAFYFGHFSRRATRSNRIKEPSIRMWNEKRSITERWHFNGVVAFAKRPDENFRDCKLGCFFPPLFCQQYEKFFKEEKQLQEVKRNLVHRVLTW